MLPAVEKFWPQNVKLHHLIICKSSILFLLPQVVATLQTTVIFFSRKNSYDFANNILFINA